MDTTQRDTMLHEIHAKVHENSKDIAVTNANVKNNSKLIEGYGEDIDKLRDKSNKLDALIVFASAAFTAFFNRNG